MKVSLVKFGVVSDKNYKALSKEYHKKIGFFSNISVQEIKLSSNQEKLTQAFEKIRKESEFLVLLDERGRQLTSVDQAKLIQSKIDDPGVRNLTFLVGGAYGFSDEQRNRANFLWSFSKGVFPNELAWVMLAEQIYRSFSIIKGTPYHHA